MKNAKYIDLQFHAAETNLTMADDIEPAISVDHISKITSNINELMTVLGITNLTAMAAGTQIKIYKTEVANTPDQVGEGETILLTKVTRKLAKTITLTLKKYRKATSAEDIQKNGYNNAVNITDDKLLSEVQKNIKKAFFALILTGTAKASGTNLQKAASAAWAKLQILFEDEDVNAVYFMNPTDVADYLGNAAVTMQTAFGLSYIENFLGLGTVIVNNNVTAGKVVATAKENIYGAYVPVASSDIGKVFGLTSDKTGMVGMTHTAKTDNATLETLLLSGVIFYPERLDGIVVSDIEAEATESGTTQSN